VHNHPFIDIHTHHVIHTDDTVRVVNLYPGDAIPAFSGKNFYSVGLHPWKIKSEKENTLHLQIMEDALEFDHVIFAGECGLDKITGAGFEEQRRVLLAQMILAEDYQKPLIIHCVRAYYEIIELYNSYRPTVPWIFHGYSGNLEITEQLANKQFLFSFGKILFNAKARAVESFRQLPLEKVFLETDEFNKPVSAVYAKAAEIKNITVKELKEAIWENFNRLENVSFDV
jgi:TatD DNase family protein